MDYGSRYADRRQKIIERRLQTVYREAQKDLEKKFDEFLETHRKQGEKKWQQLQNGEITQAEYSRWMREQVLIGKRWQRKIDAATETLAHANEKALTIVRGEQMYVFAENANHEAFEIEKDFEGAVSFDVYNVSAVDRLIREKPELLPRSTLDNRKDKAWNQGVIARSVTQAIIQGESIPNLAKRLSRDTANTDMKAMVRYARTAVTGAQNAGKLETMNRAQDLGIKIQKQWRAILDTRTRDSHQQLDGQVQDIDKPFESILGEIMFPGDLGAKPGDIWNCRCGMKRIYPEFPNEQAERIAYDDEVDENGNRKRVSYYVPGDMTYSEWKEMKRSKGQKPEKGKKPEENPMTAEEYEEWQKEYSTKKELVKQYEEKYAEAIKAAKSDKYGDVYLDKEEKWLSEIKDEMINDPLYQVNNGYGHCGYIQAADGSKAINAYLRRGEIGKLYSAKEMQKTIDAMDRLIGVTKLNKTIAVDRCAGIDALERLGINCGEHGRTYRIGHAFCTDGVDMETIVSRINDEFVGSTIVDKGYMSASVVPEKNIFGGSDVTFTVIAPKGTNAFITENTIESEVIFEHGTEQRIVGARVAEREVKDWDGNKTKRKTIEVFVEIVQK